MRRLPVVLLALSATAIAPAAAGAATITVTTTGDSLSADGACSLREAVIAANTDTAGASGSGGCAAGSGADTIVVPAGTYRLTRAPGTPETTIPDPTAFDLDVREPATIRGAGAATTIIDANGIDRAVDASKSLRVEGLTFTGGRPADPRVTTSDGGGAINAFGDLAIVDCVFTDNRSFTGEAGASHTGSGGGFEGPPAGFGIGEFGGRGGDGGAVYAAGGDLSITGSRFAGNQAGAGGAGGDGTGGTAPTSIHKATNVIGGTGFAGGGGKGGDGGAVYAALGGTITNTTFVGNTAGTGGRSGDAQGGPGGAILDVDNQWSEAGQGGGALVPTAGDGGDGGAVYVARAGAIITSSSFAGNRAGTGGASGTATGGQGGSLGALAGGGGPATVNGGGAGGAGGAIATVAAASTIKVIASTSSGDRAGTGGAGGQAKGGSKGFGSTGGDGIIAHGSLRSGNASGGAGGAGGRGGALSAANGATLVNLTADGDASGAGGAGGGASAGTGTPPATLRGGDGGASGAGGAIAALGGDFVITNATLTGNAPGAPGAPGAAGAPGGAAGAAGGGGALFRAAGTLAVTNALMAGNAAACAGTITDGGGNVRAAGDGPCPGAAGDAQLGPLRDNGGPVPTRADGGAAVDAAQSGSCPATDARGAKRPAGGGCDAGAYERTAPDASTGLARSIVSDGATLVGTANPQGPPATVRFQYGRTKGYGQQTGAQQVGPGFAAREVTAPVDGLKKGTTIHYRLVVATSDGTANGADATFVVGKPGSSAGGGGGGPRLTKVSVRPRRFRVGRRRTATSAVRRGTTFRLRLSERATVRFAIARRTTGRRVKKGARRRCVPRRGQSGGRPCTRYAAAGTLKRRLKAGRRAVRFSGRIGRRALKPGRYRVRVRAADRAGRTRSRTVTLRFTVLPG